MCQKNKITLVWAPKGRGLDRDWAAPPSRKYFEELVTGVVTSMKHRVCTKQRNNGTRLEAHLAAFPLSKPRQHASRGALNLELKSHHTGKSEKSNGIQPLHDFMRITHTLYTVNGAESAIPHCISRHVLSLIKSRVHARRRPRSLPVYRRCPSAPCSLRWAGLLCRTGLNSKELFYGQWVYRHQEANSSSEDTLLVCVILALQF